MHLRVPFRLLLHGGQPMNISKRSLTDRLRFVLPMAAPILTTVGESRLVSQVFEGVDYCLYLSSYRLEDEVFSAMEVNHPFIALLLGLEGGGQLGKELMPVGGENQYSLIYVPSGLHAFSIKETHATFLFVIFPPTTLYTLAKEHTAVRGLYEKWLYEGPHIARLPEIRFDKRVIQVLNKLFHWAGTAATIEQEVRIYLLQLSVLYHQHLGLEAGRRAHQAVHGAVAVEEVIVYIGQYLDSDELIHTEALANRFQCTVSALQQQFKFCTSLSLQDFIREERLLRARRLLQTGQVSVSEAAFEVGYTAVSNFVRAYKKYFGHTPGQHKDVG